MNSNNNDLYAGLAGCKLGPKKYDLGKGITISRTYAKLMMPFMVTFSKPTKEDVLGGHLRGTEAGGMGFIINNQIYISKEIKKPKQYNLEKIGLLLTSLLRLHCNSDVHLVLYSNKPFIYGGSPEHKMKIWPIEIEPYSMKLFEKGKKNIITIKSLEWIKNNWLNCANLLISYPKFNLAFHTFSRCTLLRSESLALISLWGALESLFSTSRSEISFRMSSYISVFLDEPGEGRYKFQKRVSKLYNSRSFATHGAIKKFEKSFLDTYSILKLVLIKIIENNHVPTEEDLLSKMFGYDNK